MNLFRLIPLLFMLIFAIGETAAQAPTSPLVAEQRIAIDGFARQVDELTRRVEAATEDDARLVDLRVQLETLAAQVLETGVKFRPRLAEINARLEQLGPAPGEGAAAEPEIVATERLALVSEKAEINALLGIAEGASIRANQEIDRIAVVRRDLFANTLSKRYDLSFALNGEMLRDLRAEGGDLYRTVASWLRFVGQFKLSSVLGATFLAVLAGAILLIGGRRLFGRLIEPDPAREDPSYLSRLSVAFWSTLIPSMAFNVFLGSAFVFYDTYNVLRGDIRPLLLSAMSVAAVVFFVHRLAKAALSPDLPNWRLIEVESRPARILLWLTTATAFVSGIDFFLNQVSETLSSPLSLTVAKSLLATVVVGLLLVAMGFVKPYADPETGAPKPWPAWLRTVLFLLGGVTIAAALLGFIGFARFMSQQIVVTGAILATMYIGFLSARAISEEGAFAGTAVGRRIERRFNFDETTLDQIGLATSIGLNILVLLWGVPLILLQWGFRGADISGWLYRAANGFTIGTISISFVGIFSGILVFILGFFLTRGFQGWLDGTVMARGRVDAGVRNSIRTAVGYAGVALAGLVGVSAAGIDLSNLALIAGGLSLGIGFGMQNIVSNFVSGLILLAERPFKAGDWIVAGPVSGTVRKISVRATEIETFQRQTVILPNSELINAAVGNWTHKNKLGRVEIPVGISYDSDARRAHAILTEIARGHPLVLKNPEPFVLFVGFGDSSLDFEIRLFLADITTSLGVQNDVRFAILERFAEAEIDIPFPHRDITLRSVNGELLDLPTMAREREADGEAPAVPVGVKRRRGKKTDAE